MDFRVKHLVDQRRLWNNQPSIEHIIVTNRALLHDVLRNFTSDDYSIAFFHNKTYYVIKECDLEAFFNMHKTKHKLKVWIE